MQTMLDLGISQTAIGKATGRSRTYVRNAQAAATVDEALSVAADGCALTPNQLADLAPFTDEQDATSRLLDSA